MKKTSPITAVLDPSMTAETKEKYKDLIAFATEIDFTPLFKTISKKLGLAKTLKFSPPRLYERCGEFHFDCESANIADQVGVLALILNEVRITFFSNRMMKDEERNCHFFWAAVHFSYRHMSGGSNGLDFLTACFENEKGWTFKFAEPRSSVTSVSSER
jgi:hypothetical protein